MDRKLHVNIKNGLNLENQITSKSVDPYTKLCKRRLSHFFQSTHFSLKLQEPLKLSFLDLQDLNLETPITNEAVDPYSPIFQTPCVYIYIYKYTGSLKNGE